MSNRSPSEPSWKGVRVLTIVLVAVCSLAPPLVYGLLFGRIPTVTPAEAKERLSGQGPAALLVDVRAHDLFSAGHIDGAVHWPLSEILSVNSPADIPADYRDKRLLLVCDVGMASRWAASHLSSIGLKDVANVRGGIQEWIRVAANAQPLRKPPRGSNLLEWLETAPAPQGGEWDRWRIEADRVIEFPFRRSPIHEQAVAVLSYFFIKPIYMGLSLVVAALLWRSLGADLTALRWSMLAFFAGEAACAVNYFVFREISYLWEYLHGLGMLVSFGFVTYAILEGFDRRVLSLSDPQRRCASLPLCGRCIKYEAVPCRLKQMFYVFSGALLIVALMLPLADWQDTSYNTLVFGSVYNYAHLRVHQQFENVFCAISAAVMFAATLAVLCIERDQPVAVAKVLFAAGVGPLGFGMLRMVLGGAYDNHRVWYLFWEETTELLFIAGVGITLWIFRRTLLGKVE